MNIIFQIDGGLGKSILGTAMVKIIKKRYKNSKLIVVTGHPDVFLNNPLVDQVYELHQIGGFYLRYIKDQDCKLFIAEPYKHSDFFATDNQLIRTWCKTFGLSYGGEQPEIFLTKPELEYFSPFYKMDKPILAIHTNGGHKSQSYNYISLMHYLVVFHQELGENVNGSHQDDQTTDILYYCIVIFYV